MNTTKPKPKKQYVDTNPVESFRDFGKGVSRALSQDLLKDGASSMWDQFLGLGEYKPQTRTKGDLAQGEELDLSSFQKRSEVQERQNIEPGIDYRREIVHAERRVIQEDQGVIHSKIEQILVEIRKIIATSSEIEVQYRQLAVEDAPSKAGKYHVTFFEWVLTTIRAARMKVEDSATWLSMFASKKKQKQYWNMFKKYKTTFGLSNERVVSTQTG